MKPILGIAAVLIVLIIGINAAVNGGKGTSKGQSLTAQSSTSTPVKSDNSSQAAVAATKTPAPPPPTLNAAEIAQATHVALVAGAGNLPSGSDDTYYYSDLTQHSVSGFGPGFSDFGGVASLGLPISEPFLEQSAADGKLYWVQYYEKAVLEWHKDDPSNHFQLASIGAWRFNEKYSSGVPASKPVPGKGTYTFAETGKTLSGLFLDYWHANGEISRFGFPLSESFEEVSEADGKTYIVQYFERAVFEYHPELKAGSRVQLTALGNTRIAKTFAGGVPDGAGNPVPSPTINVAATAKAVANATGTAQRLATDATATAQQAIANATSTAIIKQANANATSEARKYESYKTTAPEGDFRGSGNHVAISFKLQYQKCISSWCADNNSKFILVGVAVTNVGYDSVHVNPLNFTLVSTRGATVGYDSNTFLLNNYLDAIDIRPGNYTNGWMAFLVTKDFIPGELVWEEFLGETVTAPIVDAP